MQIIRSEIRSCAFGLGFSPFAGPGQTRLRGDEQFAAR
jgi:hypothetical protein